MNEEAKKIRIAGYARVSTESQAKEGESLKVQEEEIKRYAAAHGYQLTGIYIDKGVSGGKKDRPELDKLRQDAKAKKFDKVVFTKLSRFGRNITDLLELFREFEDKYKIGLISLKEMFDTTTTSGRLLRNILAAIAEFERDTIRTQMKEGKLNRLKRNECFIGKVPYGYRFNKEKKIVEVTEEEKAVYLDVVNQFLNQNISLQNISLILNRKGIKSPKGCRWVAPTLSYMLKNPAYKGELIVNRFECGTTNRIYEKDTEGRRVGKEKPESEWVTFPFPRFIDEYTWGAIQQKIRFNAGKPKNEKYPDLFIASGLINCGICGSKVSIKNGNEKKNGEALHYYACFLSRASAKALELSGRKKCNLPRIRMEDVDDYLWVRIVNLLTYPEDALKKAITEKTNIGELQTEKQRVDSEIKSTERKIERLLSDTIETDDPNIKVPAKKKMKELSSHTQELKNRLSEIHRELSTIEQDKRVMDSLNLSVFRKELKQCLHSLPGVEKKHLIRILVSPENGGAIILRPMTEGDRQLDDKVFTEGKIKAGDHVEGRVSYDFNFKIQGEKIIGAFEYLKNKGFLPNKVKNGWLAPL